MAAESQGQASRSWSATPTCATSSSGLLRDRATRSSAASATPATIGMLRERPPSGDRPRSRPRRPSRPSSSCASSASSPTCAPAPLIVLSVAQRLRHLREGQPPGRDRVRHQAVPPRGAARQGRRGRRERASSAAPAASSSAPSSSAAASSARRSSTRRWPTRAPTAAVWARSWCARASSPSRTSSTALAGQMRIGVADTAQMTPDAKAMGLLPRDFIVRHRLMPLRLDDNGNLDPGDDQPARRHLDRRGQHAHRQARRAGHLHRERVRRGGRHLLQHARQAQGLAR